MENKIKNIRKEFVLENLKDKEAIKLFFKDNLPSVILKHLDINTVKLEKNSYLSEKNQKEFLDFSFKVKLDTKVYVYIYILLYYKKKSKNLLSLHVVNHMYAVLSRELTKKKVTPVMPFSSYYSNRSKKIKLKPANKLKEINDIFDE